MVGLIISGHGDWATGILSAAGMISGQTKQVQAVPFRQGEGIEDIKRHFQKAIKRFPPQIEILFLLDMYGGSPYNAAISLAYAQNSYDIVTGVSLPMVLEALTMNENCVLSEILLRLKQVDRSDFRIFSEEEADLLDLETFKEDEL